MQVVRTGLIGVGRWGGCLAAALTRCASMELVAMCDLSPHRLIAYEQWARYPRASSLIERDDLEAVIIATPPAAHADLVRTALQAGKHVLCEKPLAMTSSECESLGEISAQFGRCLMVNCIPVYFDEIQRARKEIDWNSVCSIHCVRTSTRVPADLAELLWDLAPHDLAVLYHWLGSLPAEWECEQVSPQTLRLHGVDACGRKLEIRVGSSRIPQRRIKVQGVGWTRSFMQRQQRPEPLQKVFEHFAQAIRSGAPCDTGPLVAAAVTRVLSQVCSQSGTEMQASGSM